MDVVLAALYLAVVSVFIGIALHASRDSKKRG
jgi:hypothetical protein